MNKFEKSKYLQVIWIALLTGFYVSVFHISNNLTLLPPSSIAFLALVLIVPFALFVALFRYLALLLNKEAYISGVTIAICVVYILMILRPPFLEIDGVGTIAKVLYYLLLSATIAIIVALIFRKHTNIFAVVLGVMSAVAVATGFTNALSVYRSQSGMLALENQKVFQQASLANKPNIYFILADGYTSFKYLDQSNIDVSVFKNYLNQNKFRLYEDVYSNYQPTAASLTAMLNGEHHYYVLSTKIHEVSKSGRIIIGGKNNLIRLLKRNSYTTQYIHQNSYLLVYGCSVDYCFPSVNYAGAKTVLNAIMPSFLKTNRRSERLSIGQIQEELQRLHTQNQSSETSYFQYIHIFQPRHTQNDVRDICDEAYEMGEYSNRVAEANDYLTQLINGITSRDPTAVIVASGDHGPYVSEQCAWNYDLDSEIDYRDHAGVLLAIRWPDSYDGRFDDQIKTTINVFRYVLAFLMEDDTEILNSRVPDDVYVNGSHDFLRILKNGEPLVPPEYYSKEKLMQKYIDQQRLGDSINDLKE